MVTALGRGQARPSVVTGNTIYDCSSHQHKRRGDLSRRVVRAFD